jgi:hypothetical protein
MTCKPRSTTSSTTRPPVPPAAPVMATVARAGSDNRAPQRCRWQRLQGLLQHHACPIRREGVPPDDEKGPVPVTFTRVNSRLGLTTVNVEVWESIQRGLPTLAPYQANLFK